ncbi:MAG: glycosyltransferase family 2 protein [Gammaproteobacteria bacterium]
MGNASITRYTAGYITNSLLAGLPNALTHAVANAICWRCVLADHNNSSLRLSVVIPTHNRARTIERAIRSVLSQGMERMEVIVVDDASTDDTEQVIEALGDRRVRYIWHETNRGAPAARNTGIAAASGDLIAFQDSDDEWMPNKLAKQLQLFEAGGSNVDVVYSGFLRQSSEARIYIPEPWVACRQGNILQQLLSANFVGTPTMVIRRGCFEKYGDFDETLPRYQDWEFAIRLAKHYPFFLVDEPLVIAYESAGNISSDDEAGLRALELILRKHHDMFQENPRTLCNHLCLLGHAKCLQGKMAAGRKDLLHALKAWPLRGKAWVALLGTLVGARAYKAAASWMKQAQDRSADKNERTAQSGRTP